MSKPRLQQVREYAMMRYYASWAARRLNAAGYWYMVAERAQHAATGSRYAIPAYAYNGRS
jgi:hypothetical protein